MFSFFYLTLVCFSSFSQIFLKSKIDGPHQAASTAKPGPHVLAALRPRCGSPVVAPSGCLAQPRTDHTASSRRFAAGRGEGVPPLHLSVRAPESPIADASTLLPDRSSQKSATHPIKAVSFMSKGNHTILHLIRLTEFSLVRRSGA